MRSMSTATPRCCGRCATCSDDRDQVRLRPGAVRRLHRACRRRGDADLDSIGESAITTIEAIGQTPQGAALQKAWLYGFAEVIVLVLARHPVRVAARTG